MEVSLHANMSDQTTEQIAKELRDPLESLGRALSKDYGGTISHLWIDFELIRDHWRDRPPRTFRFQKKVGGGICHLTGLKTEVCENVGHYNVVPDFDALLALPLKALVPYVLGQIYESTSILVTKQKKLGGFNATQLREDFHSWCAEHGYPLILTEEIR